MSDCGICGGVGLVRVMSGEGRWVSRPCECQEMRREDLRVSAARIPERYRHCSLDTFDPSFPGADGSLKEGLIMARRFVDEYPMDTAGKGLLFVGTVGPGRRTWPWVFFAGWCGRKACTGCSAITANC